MKQFTDEEFLKVLEYACSYQKGHDYIITGGIMIVDETDKEDKTEKVLNYLASPETVHTEIVFQDILDFIEEEKEKTEYSDDYIPSSLEGAVRYLYSKIPEDQIEAGSKMSKNEFLSNTHHFLGRNLRNDWHLWFNDPDNPLTTYFTSIDINHGDDRSGMILDSLYRRIVGLPIDIESQVKRYKKHWKEAGFKDGIFPVPDSTEAYMKKHAKSK